MFPVRDDFWVLPFPPPSEIRPGALLYRTSCPSPLSFRPFSSSPSIMRIQPRPSSVWSPPSSVPHRPYPIVRPPESYQPSGSGRPMSSPSFPTQCTICRLAPPPPPTYTAGGTWLGCGCVWRGERRGTPAVVLSPSSRRQASPDRRPSACLRPTLDFHLDSCGPQ